MTPAFPPFPGGGERYVRSLALELVKQGHSITAVTSTATLEKDFWNSSAFSVQHSAQEGIHLIRLPLKPIPGGRTGLMLWRKMMVLVSAVSQHSAVLHRMSRLIPPLQELETTLRQLNGRFDLVHGFNISWEYPLVAGWRFARQQKIPFVVTPFAHLGQKKGDRVALNSTMAHQLQVLQDADQVLTLTSVERDGLADYHISPGKVSVIGGGVDPMPVKTAVSAPSLPVPYALFIGRLSHDKGAIHAAQAICQLRQQGVNICLGLMGQNTPEFEHFYQHLTETEQAGIRPLGLLTEAEKHALLDEAAIFLLPSQADSFGIVLLEAWTHGVPVIAARSGGIPGVVDEGENGLLVNFGDVPTLSQAIQQLLQDEPLRQQLGENGRIKTQTVYTWESVGQRVAQIYKRVKG